VAKSKRRRRSSVVRKAGCQWKQQDSIGCQSTIGGDERAHGKSGYSGWASSDGVLHSKQLD